MRFLAPIVQFLLKFVSIDAIAKWLLKTLTQLDDKAIDYIFNLVIEADKKYLGEDGFKKRLLVYEKAKQQLNDVADSAINLAIEIAVSLLKKGLLKETTPAQQNNTQTK